MARACATFTDGQLCRQSLRKLKQRYAKTQRLTAAIKYSPARLCQRQTRRLTADEQNAKNPLHTLKAREKKQTYLPPRLTEREKVRLVPSFRSQVRTSHSCHKTMTTEWLHLG